MSDAKLRDLERRWKETGTVEDEAAYLLERVRAGDLTRERLELAAYCGHEGASAASGISPVGNPHDLVATIRPHGEAPMAVLVHTAVSACRSIWTDGGLVSNQELQDFDHAIENALILMSSSASSRAHLTDRWYHATRSMADTSSRLALAQCQDPLAAPAAHSVAEAVGNLMCMATCFGALAHDGGDYFEFAAWALANAADASVNAYSTARAHLAALSLGSPIALPRPASLQSPLPPSQRP